MYINKMLVNILVLEWINSIYCYSKYIIYCDRKKLTKLFIICLLITFRFNENRNWVIKILHFAQKNVVIKLKFDLS